MTAVSTMTGRERWLAALNMQPLDRLPFWPKLPGNYMNLQEEKYQSLSRDEMFDFLGCDHHDWVAPCAHLVRKNTAQERVAESDGSSVITTYKAGGKELRMVEKYDAPSCSYHPVEHPCKTVEDVKVMTEIYNDTSYEPDKDQVAEARERINSLKDRGLVVAMAGESPLMIWIEILAGVENGHYMLLDHEDEVEALFEAIHGDFIRRTEVLAGHSPCDAVYLMENTSTTLISPDQYQKYCARHLPAYAEIINASGKKTIIHMCGLLKELLPQVARQPVAAFEAFTSPPVGNTTLRDGREACPEICLIGGTNARLWMHDADTIIGEIKSHLDELPHHRGVVVTSAGVMPPVATPETIKAVCDFVKSYPVRF